MEPFKKQHKIKIMHSSALVNKAPVAWNASDWRRFYTTFRQVEVSPYTFAGLVWQGHSFIPCYKNGRRLESNFTEAWHMAFDFDAHGAALDYLMRPGSIAWVLSSFAYATPSSTDDHPKSRVVFIFDEPITDTAYYRQLYQALAWLFQEDGSHTDPACKDPLRLYYGSKSAEMRGNWSAILRSGMDAIIQQYEDAHPPEPEQPALTLPVRRVNDDTRAAKILQSLADNIAVAPDGERHHARLVNARTAGGYIASGVMSQADVEAVLISAAIANTGNRASAEKTIRDGIEYGKQAPLYLEEVDHTAPRRGDLDFLKQNILDVM